MDATSEALARLAAMADALPGAFRPEFELGYWSGVDEGSESWYVHFEGDIEGNEFTVLGHTAADAINAAASRLEPKD